MTEQDQKRFAELCLRDMDSDAHGEGSGIGTYREKRLHRILKAWVCDREDCWEIPVGRYVADVLRETSITEIQTGSLRPLVPKIRYYLEHTDCQVTVLHPVIAEKTLIRMDRETGEVLYQRRSPKKSNWMDALAELFWISDWLTDPRLTVRVVLIRADEIRYSERVRYRREGAFDSELYPKEIEGDEIFSKVSDYRCFLPNDRESFTAAEYGALMKLRGRKQYSALNCLCKLGLLSKEQDGRKYRYRIR